LRLQRFLDQHTLRYDEISKFIFNLFFSDKKIYVVIDRTNWFWGKAKLNLLTLGVAYEGVAIPLIWCVLNKAGNASAKEHSAVIARFIKLFGTDCILGILGDREFASGDFFKFLNEHHVPFYIRIKENSWLSIKSKKFSQAKKLFSHLNLREKNTFQMSIWLYGQKVYLAGSCSERGVLMIVATNQDPHHAIEIYLRRWEIEMLFACLKGRGFLFEETHVTDRQRIKKMMALLAIGFCWAHKPGEWLACLKPIRFSKHRQGGLRPQRSYLRYGLDYIRELILNPHKTMASFRSILKLFQPLITTSGEPS